MLHEAQRFISGSLIRVTRVGTAEKIPIQKGNILCHYVYAVWRNYVSIPPYYFFRVFSLAGTEIRTFKGSYLLNYWTFILCLSTKIIPLVCSTIQNSLGVLVSIGGIIWGKGGGGIIAPHGVLLVEQRALVPSKKLDDQKDPLPSGWAKTFFLCNCFCFHH